MFSCLSFEVVSNDDLFAGESSYKEELGNFVMDLVKSISPSSDGMQGDVSGMHSGSDLFFSWT
jgi:hypothetical protein